MPHSKNLQFMYGCCGTLNLWYSADRAKAYSVANMLIEKAEDFGWPREIPLLILKVSVGRPLHSRNIILKYSASAQGPGAVLVMVLTRDKTPAPSLNITSYRHVVFCANTARAALAQTCRAQLEQGYSSKACYYHHSHLFSLTLATSHIISYKLEPGTLAFWPDPSTWSREVKVPLKRTVYPRKSLL